MKTLVAITICIISVTAMAQSRVVPVTVTGGTIEVESDALPTIMSEDGNSEEQSKDITISRLRLVEEENKVLQNKINELIQKRISTHYDYIDVIQPEGILR